MNKFFFLLRKELNSFYSLKGKGDFFQGEEQSPRKETNIFFFLILKTRFLFFMNRNNYLFNLLRERPTLRIQETGGTIFFSFLKRKKTSSPFPIFILNLYFRLQEKE